MQKQDEGIELIDGGQKFNLYEDRLEHSWKTVGEYLDNQLWAGNDEDTKMKAAKKDEQKKINEAHASKMAKKHALISRISRPNGRGGLFLISTGL